MILILGEKHDPHIREVCRHLAKMGARHTVVDPLETLLLPGGVHPDSTAKYYTAIWDRLKPVAAPKSNRDQYIVRERIAAIRSLQLLHARERLMNPPAGTDMARSKLFQLKMAQQAGLTTPRTYLGNDPKAVRKFVAGCDQGAIAKCLTWFFDPSGNFSFTNVLTPDALRSNAAIACSPMIYQEYIPKKYELRVTCVGERVFAAKIFSQKNPRTVIDWRRDQFNVDYEVTALPTAVERKMMQLLDALGLHYGAFDFIVTPDDQFVFLEVNSSGNWLWLETLLSLPISRAIADWLCKAGVQNRPSPENESEGDYRANDARRLATPPGLGPGSASCRRSRA